MRKSILLQRKTVSRGGSGAGGWGGGVPSTVVVGCGGFKFIPNSPPLPFSERPANFFRYSGSIAPATTATTTKPQQQQQHQQSNQFLVPPSRTGLVRKVGGGESGSGGVVRGGAATTTMTKIRKPTRKASTVPFRKYKMSPSVGWPSQEIELEQGKKEGEEEEREEEEEEKIDLCMSMATQRDTVGAAGGGGEGVEKVAVVTNAGRKRKGATVGFSTPKKQQQQQQQIQEKEVDENSSVIPSFQRLTPTQPLLSVTIAQLEEQQQQQIGKRTRAKLKSCEEEKKIPNNNNINNTSPLIRSSSELAELTVPLAQPLPSQGSTTYSKKRRIQMQRLEEEEMEEEKKGEEGEETRVVNESKKKHSLSASSCSQKQHQKHREEEKQEAIVVPAASATSSQQKPQQQQLQQKDKQKDIPSVVVIPTDVEKAAVVSTSFQVTEEDEDEAFRKQQQQQHQNPHDDNPFPHPPPPPGDDLDASTIFASWGMPPSVISAYEATGLKRLFPWQKECLEKASKLKRSIVCCCPTNAGKTLIAEIAALRCAIHLKKRAIFVLPFVSIVVEKAESLGKLFRDVNARVVPYYGGKNHFFDDDDKRPEISICTIEKANSIVNKLLAEKRMEDLGTVIVDEVHMLGDAHRGFLLELMLTKVRYSCGPSLQIVCLSATLPNSDAIAKWLSAEHYVTSFRPVPLEHYAVVGRSVLLESGIAFRQLPPPSVEDPDNLFQLCFESTVEGHSVLVFCSSKQGTEIAARLVADVANKRPGGLRGQRKRDGNNGNFEFQEEREVLIESLRRTSLGLDSTLEACIPHGVAFHHAGLTTDERELIESAFSKGVICVLVATTTLAAGVNLPVRRVIIRSPLIGRDFLDTARYQQMAGRAGRTGRDTKGESILMLTNRDKVRGLQIMKAKLPPITSCLIAENEVGSIQNGMGHALLEIIALSVSSTVSELKTFIQHTLFAHLNPSSTGEKSIAEATTKDGDVAEVSRGQVSGRAQATGKMALRMLESTELISWDGERGIFEATAMGRATVASGLGPIEGIAVFSCLQRAKHRLVLDDDLQLTFQLTPVHQMFDPNWRLMWSLYKQLGETRRAAADAIGVDESYLEMKSKRSPPAGSFSLLEPRKNSKGYEMSRVAIHRRFFTALVLQDLADEAPVWEVSSKFNIPRGSLQSLQIAAGYFASCVGAFCHHLQWEHMHVLFKSHAGRLEAGAKADVVHLMALPGLKTRQARALLAAGLHTLQLVAEASVADVDRVLRAATPFVSGQTSASRTASLRLSIRIVMAAKSLVAEEFAKLQHQMNSLTKKGPTAITAATVEATTTTASAIDARKESGEGGEGAIVKKTPRIPSMFAPPVNSSSSNGKAANRAPLNVSADVRHDENKGKTATTAAAAALPANEDDQSCRPWVKTFSSKKEDIPKIEEFLVKLEAAKVISLCFVPRNLAEQTQGSQISNECPPLASSAPAASQRSLSSVSQDLNPAIVLGVAICVDDNSVYFVHLSTFRNEVAAAVKDKAEDEPSSPIKRLRNQISAALRDRSKTKVMFRAVMQLKLLISAGTCTRIAPLEDPSVASWMIRRSYDFPENVSIGAILAAHNISISNYDSNTSSNKTLALPPHPKGCVEIAAFEAAGSWRLQHNLVLCLQENHLLDRFKIEMNLAHVLAHVEYWGIGFDLQAYHRVTAAIESRVQALHSLAEKISGCRLTTLSSRELAHVIYDRLHLAVPDTDSENQRKKGGQKANARPVSKEYLTLLSRTHIFPALILERKRLARIISTHLVNLSLHCKTHNRAENMLRMHCQHQLFTTTGRVGCHSPNLQCIPHARTISSSWLKTLAMALFDEQSPISVEVEQILSRFDEEISIRDCFVAQPGWTIISVDFCHTELRIMAHISGDENLKAALQSDRDVFCHMASTQLGIPIENVSAEQRDLAKRICYGLMYGMGPHSLASQLGLQVEEAQKLVDGFFASFPRLKSSMDKMIDQLKERGYVETIRGRQRSIPTIHSKDVGVRNAAARQAVNSVCQGSAADILKEALVFLLHKIEDKPIRIILQVHDEIVLEVRNDFQDEACKIVTEAVFSAAQLGVPLPVKISIGQKWGSLRLHAVSGKE